MILATFNHLQRRLERPPRPLRHLLSPVLPSNLHPNLAQALKSPHATPNVDLATPLSGGFLVRGRLPFDRRDARDLLSTYMFSNYSTWRETRSERSLTVICKS